jgi:hypothetical protein
MVSRIIKLAYIRIHLKVKRRIPIRIHIKGKRGIRICNKVLKRVILCVSLFPFLEGAGLSPLLRRSQVLARPVAAAARVSGSHPRHTPQQSQIRVYISAGDPDPDALGPSGSGSISQRYGSGYGSISQRYGSGYGSISQRYGSGSGSLSFLTKGVERTEMMLAE